MCQLIFDKEAEKKAKEAAQRRLVLHVSEPSASSATPRDPPEFANKVAENSKGVPYSSTSSQRSVRVSKQFVEKILAAMNGYDTYVSGTHQIPAGEDKEVFHQEFIANFINEIMAGEVYISPGRWQCYSRALGL